MKKQGAKPSTKRKYNASFTPEDRAAIGRCTAENGNAAAVKKFKTTHGVGEYYTIRGTWKKSRSGKAQETQR